MPELYRRSIEFRADAHADGDSIPCTLSSEAAVNRGDYLEVLSHRLGDVNLSRAPLPLLVQHDSSQLNIGLIEDIRLEGQTLKGLARFGSGAVAQQILQDIKGGILRNLSVGYQLLRTLSETGRTLRFAWMPYECSVVSVPADSNAGFYRSNSFQKGNQMPEITALENENVTASRSQRRAATQGIESERERTLEITAMGRIHKMADAADKAIEAGFSVDQFRDHVLANLEVRGVLRPAESPDIGMSSREIERYSLARAILSLGDPAYAMRQGSFELECSRAAADRLGKNPQGLLIPAEVLSSNKHKRDLVSSSAAAGGNLVATDHLGGAFVDMMRERTLALELGATVLAGLTGNLAVPTQVGAATGYWVTEGNDITETQAVFGQVNLTPKTVGAFTDFSRKMLLQSSPDIESLIRADLAEVLGRALDAAVFNGSGSGAEPTGILKTSGLASVAIHADGGALTWDHLLQLEEALHIALASGAGGLSYVTTPAARRKAKGTLKVSGDAGTGWLWENGRRDDFGQMNGYRAAATTYLPSNLTKGGGSALSAMILGYFPDVLIGMWGGLDIMLDPYALATSGGKRVVALLDVDIAIRRLGSFATCVDIKTT